MRSEDKLKEQFGQQNPFEVPQDYFDKFADSMLELIPERSADEPAFKPLSKRAILFNKAKPYLYLAAMFAGLYFTINVVKQQHDNTRTAQTETLQSAKTIYVSDEEYVEEVCRYAGIGKEDIYSYAMGQEYSY